MPWTYQDYEGTPVFSYSPEVGKEPTFKCGSKAVGAGEGTYTFLLNPIPAKTEGPPPLAYARSGAYMPKEEQPTWTLAELKDEIKGQDEKTRGGRIIGALNNSHAYAIQSSDDAYIFPDSAGLLELVESNLPVDRAASRHKL